MDSEQRSKVANDAGFIAALDQSGGSTPKALRLYGIEESQYDGDEAKMFDLVHEMRSRIITSPSFDGDRILGAILFEQTMDRDIEDLGTAEYLWQRKRVVPFLKIDKGLAGADKGVKLMKPIPDLDTLLPHAVDKGVVGTKMRSVIDLADADGVAAIVDQQFEYAADVLRHGLVPIIEPEVDIRSTQKAEAEQLLKDRIAERLDSLTGDDQVMLKLTLPSTPGFYTDFVQHPKILRVVALSGGYSRDEANQLLAANPGVIASFSRALSEGLTAQQTDDEFNALLDKSIASIFAASRT